MPDLRYEAPGTLADAVKLLASAGGTARILAGGTDIIVQMETDLIEPELLIDIKCIPDLHRIVIEDGGFRIGAAVSCMAMMDHPALCATWPGVIDGVKLIGSIQVKGRATLAGNLCNASPARRQRPRPDRRRRPRSFVGPGGRREVPVEQIPVGPGKTSLGKGEIIESFLLPGGRRIRATPICASRRAPRWTLRSSASRSISRSTLKAYARRRRVALGAVAPTALLVKECADALDRHHGRRSRARQLGRRRERCLPADRRQARHQGIPHQDRRRAGKARGPDRARTGEACRMSKKYHVTTNVNGDECRISLRTAADPARRPARRIAAHRHQGRLRHRRLRRLQRHRRRATRLLLPGARRRGRRQEDRHDRGHGQGRRPASAAAQISRAHGLAVRHLHAWNPDCGARPARAQSRPVRKRSPLLAGRQPVPLYWL